MGERRSERVSKQRFWIVRMQLEASLARNSNSLRRVKEDSMTVELVCEWLGRANVELSLDYG